MPRPPNRWWGISKLTPKIRFEKYDLHHKLAKKYDVDRSPTLLLGPDRYRVKWLGAPVGEEGRTFFEALLLMGYREKRAERPVAQDPEEDRLPPDTSGCS